MATSPGDRLSQALNGGSGSALAPSTVPVTTVVDFGVHVVSGLVFRRFRSLRSFFSPADRLIRSSLILRKLADISWMTTSTLWAATPLMRRRSG